MTYKIKISQKEYDNKFVNLYSHSAKYRTAKEITEHLDKTYEIETPKKPVGVISFSAFNGLKVYSFDEDKIKFKEFYTSDGEEVTGKMITAKIRFDNDGTAYFKNRNQRVNLNDIMRTDYP
jgi:serine protease inhibitor